MKRRTKSIVCIEKYPQYNPKEDLFIKGSYENYRRELLVESVSDMVNKVIRRLCGRLIKNLYIIGHGSPGYQSVGNGLNGIILTNGKGFALRTDIPVLHGEDVESALKRLGTYFALDGKLILGGCRVAYGDRGKDLLRRISTLMNNITVEASETYQFPPPGMEGIVVRCVGETVCTVNAWGVCVEDDD